MDPPQAAEVLSAKANAVWDQFHHLPCLREVFGTLEGFPSNMPSYILCKKPGYKKHGYRTPATVTLHSFTIVDSERSQMERQAISIC